MTTLKDFMELDSCICGLDIDVRYDGHKLKEIHRFGVGAWPGNQRDYVRENVYREFSYPQEILIYLHPDPINFNQTSDKYKGVCKPWGVIFNKIPKNLLNSKIVSMRPFTAGFLDKHNNGHYYSIDLVVEDKPTEEIVHTDKPVLDNMTLDELLERSEDNGS